jgi:hypothetical protein
MISNKEDAKLIKAALILEVIGRPPEHLVQALEEIIKQINDEKGVEITSKKINEPVPMKDQKDFYTTFAEVDVDVEDIIYLAILMFKYMPAHVEIISPELIVLSNNGWSDILSELVRRLHGYDEVAGVLQMEKSILENKLREVLGNKTGPKPENKEAKSGRKTKKKAKKK